MQDFTPQLYPVATVLTHVAGFDVPNLSPILSLGRHSNTYPKKSCQRNEWAFPDTERYVAMASDELDDVPMTQKVSSIFYGPTGTTWVLRGQLLTISCESTTSPTTT